MPYSYKKHIEMLKEAGRKRIRERNIKWEETYQEKSAELKKRFDRDVGRGSYYRWEGEDFVEAMADYFVVVGPSQTKDGRKQFFAGIKKLPPEFKRKKVYAPSGKYFPNIISALSYANEMWGTPMPPGQAMYDENTIANVDIPRHVKG